MEYFSVFKVIMFQNGGDKINISKRLYVEMSEKEIKKKKTKTRTLDSFVLC